MVLEEGKSLALKGAYYSDVVRALAPEDVKQFKAWWLNEAAVPNLALRKASNDGRSVVCERCGGFMVARGGCLHCPTCGQSGGCGG